MNTQNIAGEFSNGNGVCCMIEQIKRDSLLKKIFRVLFHRVVLAGLCILLQATLLIGTLVWFREYFYWFYTVSTLLSIVVVVWLVNQESNPAFKIAWMIPILLLPVFGGLLYLLFGHARPSKLERTGLSHITEEMKRYLPQDPQVMEDLGAQSPDAVNQSRYLTRYAHCPIWKNTATTYFPTGEDKYAQLLEELKKARHFIFLEYFIVCPGVMWNAVLEILTEKAAQGVDVRLLYDDFGCIALLPGDYPHQMKKRNIRCKAFNPLRPFIDVRMNNRDHRKICVIDGHTGFTGGINFSDEYINVTHPYGQWKDTAVMLQGDAVWSLTVLFLTMWNTGGKNTEDFNPYRVERWMTPEISAVIRKEQNGFVQPFTDSPLDGESVGETVYLNLISHARRYVYINTPYLIIDNEMITMLSIAAKSGVDIRITVPHIPDKKTIFHLTRSYYRRLIQAGVRIFEYTPGFIHAKSFVVDDAFGVVGSINMDYRSLYHHFECGAWMYGTSSIAHMKADYLSTLKVSQEVTLEDCLKVPLPVRVWRGILRLFAPLL